MHSTEETKTIAVPQSGIAEDRNSDNGKRGKEETEDEEEELDEFGRVKQRRQKFKSERGSTTREEGEYDNEDDDDDDEEDIDRYRRRRSYRSRDPSPRYSRSRSPSRHRHHRRRRSSSYDRFRSESDSEDAGYYRSPYHNRRRQRSPYHRNSHRHHHRHDSQQLYDTAGRYIDTEFYPSKIYIGDLENVSYDALEDAFRRYGSIREIKMVEGKDYAFVTYDDSSSALGAIKGMHGALLGARRIKVNRAKIPERNQVGFGNVPWTDEDGKLAKEEMRSYPGSREMSPLPGPGEYNTQPPIGRALTSYDDL
ncbi:hypothetical protein BX666DRAFT_1926530 [Dichotomocladium elegans]|nr:hypothetical protein BX666DRAFT_1926530 [Dichotomocladium elegans]